MQFVELNRKGGRGHGIFFKAWNGKEPGKLTNSRSKLNVLDMAPGDAWARAEEKLVAQTRQYLAGNFAAKPSRGEKECTICHFGDFCGLRRLGGGTGEEAEGEAGE